jgi:hypothetical protein
MNFGEHASPPAVWATINGGPDIGAVAQGENVEEDQADDDGQERE